MCWCQPTLFRDTGGQKLTPGLVDKPIVLTDGWGGEVQLIIYEQGTGSWRGCVWPWRRETVGGVGASHQGHVEKGSSLQEAISWNSEGRGGLLTPLFPTPPRHESQKLGEVHYQSQGCKCGKWAGRPGPRKGRWQSLPLPSGS